MPKKLLQNRRVLILLLLLSLGLFSFGLYGLWQFRQTTSTAPVPTAATATGEPSEDLVDSQSEYDVPADHPRRILLPTIQAEGFVQKVGLDKDGNVGVPTNINLAGWFTEKSKPGDKGVSLIDGHVSGKRHPGIFKNLEQLKTGDRFEVEFGDLSRRQFEVTSVHTYHVNDIAEHMLTHDPNIDNQLNLITCAGRYDRKTAQYEKRVLVISKRID